MVFVQYKQKLGRNQPIKHGSSATSCTSKINFGMFLVDPYEVDDLSWSIITNNAAVIVIVANRHETGNHCKIKLKLYVRCT